jgi:hypothetical protein
MPPITPTLLRAPRAAAILADMTDLAPLSHLHVAAPSLTAEQIGFYATAATVIPVLFLALAVQGPGLAELLTLATRALSRWIRLLRDEFRGKSVYWATTILYYPAIFGVALASSIVFAGVEGEIHAIDALAFPQGVSLGDRTDVVSAVQYLTVLAAITPTLAILRAIPRYYRLVRAEGATADAKAAGDGAIDSAKTTADQDQQEPDAPVAEPEPPAAERAGGESGSDEGEGPATVRESG